jgi:hypothetical protein
MRRNFHAFFIKETLHVAFTSGPYCFPGTKGRSIEGGGRMLTAERTWDRRVAEWHSHVTSAEAFEKVPDRLIQLSSSKPADACVDPGAGTGSVATALAALVSSVLAVDVSTAGLAEVAFCPAAAEAGVVRSVRPGIQAGLCTR